MEWELEFVWKCEWQVFVLVVWFGKKEWELYQCEWKQKYQKKVVQNYFGQKILNEAVDERPCLSFLPYSSCPSWTSFSSSVHHLRLISASSSSLSAHQQEHKEDPQC